MKKYINALILKFDRALAFQVTEQLPEVRQYLESIGGIFVADNGWYITTYKAPELNVTKKIIFLRGSNWADNLHVDRTWDLKSNSVRDSIIAEVTTALHQFNASVYEAQALRTSTTVEESPIVFKTFAIELREPDTTRHASGGNKSINPIINE